MRADMSEQPQSAPAMLSSRLRARWYRRAAARLSLQGKLILCFMMLLLIALSASYCLFLREARTNLWRSSCERTVALAQTLSMAATGPLDSNDTANLTRISKDFVKNDNIVGVAFANSAGQVVAWACQDPDYRPQQAISGSGSSSLMQPQRAYSSVLGNIVKVTAPVLRYQTEGGAGISQGTRLVGYVTISLSTRDEEQALSRVYVILVMVGCLVLLLTFPAVYLIVHRIFAPIRQLVDATERIAHGDLDAAVASDRPDLIGMLAGSFNEMVQQVKKQRQALADANRDLEEKVQQRTAQLETANKRLSSEIAEKEDFLRAVSHDLNAPLRNISGMATMLLMKSRDKFDDDIIHRLERIQKNVEAETELIAELLELSRIKTRRQKMEPVGVEQIVHDLGDLLENDLRSNGIELLVETELPTVLCENARLRQVFQNLIDNAIKYMGDGPVRQIAIGCIPGMTETEFYVRDSGIGIDSEDLSKVFFVFRRGKNTSTRNVPGKGVGLASVKSIVETYSGSIWVESEPGKGSTFRFTINGKYVPGVASRSSVPIYRPEPAAA
jgi:signal transduction histidine kinase